jgi:hypothetical protein
MREITEKRAMLSRVGRMSKKEFSNGRTERL